VVVPFRAVRTELVLAVIASLTVDAETAVVAFLVLRTLAALGAEVVVEL